VPEPGTLSLIGLAGLGLGWRLRRKAKKAAVAVAVAVAACVLFPAAAPAQSFVFPPNFTWTSGATDNWSTGSNWTPVGPPPSTVSSTVLQFNATGTTTYTATNDVADPFTLFSAQFNSFSSGTVNLAGGALNFANQLNPAYILQMSSGAVNIANNVVSNTFSTTSSDLQLGGFGSGPVNISGVVSGVGGINLVNGGGATFTLSNPANSFASSTLTGGINLTGPGSTLAITSNTNILDPTGNSGVQFSAGTLKIAPQGSAADVVLALTTGTGALTLNAGGTLILDKGLNNSLTVTGRVILRTISGSSSGTLSILPASGIANLGTATGENLQTTIFQANVNGIIVPVVVGQAGATTPTFPTAGDFLQSNSLGAGGTIVQFQGYTNYNSVGGAFSTSTAGTEVSNVTANTTASAPATLMALRVNNSTLTIASGTTVTDAGGVFTTGWTQAGLILNNATITGGTLTFASAAPASTEPDIYVAAGTSTIASKITVTNTGNTAGLVKFGPGTLLLTNTTNTFAGTWAIYDGFIAIDRTGLAAAADATVLGAGARSIVMRGGGFEVMNGDYAPAASTKAFTIGTAGVIFKVDDTSTFTLAQASQFAPVGGSGPLFKSGTGTLVLSNSTYPLENLPAIVVNGGQLRMNLSRTAAVIPIQINNTGTLTGNLTFGGTIQVGPGGTIAPGSTATAIGTITDAGDVFQPGGIYAMKYNPGATTPVGGTANDLLAVGAGALDLSNLSSTSKFTVSLAPAVAGASSGAPISYTAATFGSVALPLGFSGANLTSLFNFTGTFAGTATATLNDATTPTRLIFTFVPKTLNNWNWSGAVSGNWSAGGNWAEGTTPASSQNTELTFGASSQAATTNDIPGIVINGILVNSGAPAYTVDGNAITFQNSSAGTAPQITSNSGNVFTVTAPLTLTNNLTVNGSGNVALNGAVAGAGLTMSGTGTLTLGNAGNSFLALSVQSGTVAVAADGALGAVGTVTGAALGTLSFTGTTATARSFNMNGGTVAVTGGHTVTLNGGTVSAAMLDGAGTFATDATNGARFVNVTTLTSVAVTSNSAADQFVHFTNSGALNVAPGVNVAGTSTVVNFNGFTNQGSGSVTLGQNSQVNVSNFQSYGTLTLAPGTFNGTSGNVTQLTNTGTAPLFFNGGSRTFISTPQQAANGNAGFDLHGNDAIVAGGLFVNNGFVFDSVGAGTHRVVADFGAVVKGAGFYQPLPRTINGGTFSAGNSPGRATTGTIVLGGPSDPLGGLSNYTWQINDGGPSTTFSSAPGVAGPTANTANQVSGWGLLLAIQRVTPPTNGNFQWDATSTDQFTIHLQTLLAPNDANGNPVAGGGYQPTGDTTAGLMSHFDPTKPYTWQLFSYAGTYTGPTDTATLDASTIFDTAGFLNPHPGRFDWVLNQATKEMDLVFTPTAVPEPGTLSLIGLAGLGLGWRLRRKAKKAA
jgi:hypothetical protein